MRSRRIVQLHILAEFSFFEGNTERIEIKLTSILHGATGWRTIRVGDAYSVKELYSVARTGWSSHWSMGLWLYVYPAQPHVWLSC
jgi:hypothetical protein